MKKLLFIVSFLYSVVVSAQLYNNEWIDYNKTYYKFKVGSTGLYRIPQAALAGIPALANADVTHFQLWRNGQEVPVYTSNGTGALTAGGYIEFWGEANDGRADQVLYRNPNDQINNSKSLFTDTAAYFLTVNPAGTNKRMVATANTIPSGVSPEPYFIHTAGIYPNETIHLGPYSGAVSEAAISASYEVGEGWTSNEISETNKTRNFQLTNLFPYTGSGAPGARVSLNVVGNSPNNRAVILQLNSTQVFNNSLSQFNYARLSSSVPVATLNGGTENISITNETTVSNNRIKIGLIEIAYPRSFNFGGASSFRFPIAAGATGKYLEISGFNYSGVPVLYDIANGRRYVADVSNPSVIKVYLQPSTIVQDLVLVSQAASNISTVASFEERNFINYQASASQGDYLMITHSNILNGSNGSQPVEEYRAYRSSAAGGGYNARVYMIDQLTDQFAYGIKGSPLSVRNFLRFARGKFSAQPKAAFIIGKGVKYISARMNESNSITSQLNLVPTFGEPASDALLAAEGSSSVPLTPIGRISVVNGNELAIYLEKVKQYEAQLTPAPGVNESAWKKNIIHMIGASDQGLIDQLYGYLNGDKPFVRDTFYGAEVWDFVKSSVPGNQQATEDRLKARINSGINLLTYFGHSSSVSLAFNLEDPLNYNNTGKYPVFHMMGCNVGDIFILDQNRLASLSTISERYLLAQGRGCIGMMAGTSVGYVYPLQIYNDEMYKLFGHDGYGYTIGQTMQKVILNYYLKYGENNDLFLRAQGEEYTLNGDPAIRLYQFEKPDYAIESDMVSVSPGVISVSEGVFTIKAKMANLGKAIDSKLIVELKRTLPDFSVKLIQRDTIDAIRNTDSLIYHIEIKDPSVEKGANKFAITIDPENRIDELFESNNSVVKEVFIFEDNITPVYPYDNSIINRQNIVLAASTGNPLAEMKSYVMEMDTTKLFNSSFKITQTKSSVGGVVEFAPGATLKDSMVYYWRVAVSSTEPQWSMASFTYLPGTINSGFGQSHYDQLNTNYREGIFIDKGRRFLYDSLRSTITVSNGFIGYTGAAGDFSVQIDGNYKQLGLISSPSGNPQMNSLRFYLIDNKTIQPLENKVVGSKGMYGSYAPIPYNHVTQINFFQFDISTPAARKTVMEFIDSIPSGFYVGLTSNQWEPSILPEVWQSDTAIFGRGISLYHKLKSIGLSGLDSVTSSAPYVFIFQKDKPGVLAQGIGKTQAETQRVSVLVPVSGTEGELRSPVFSNASSWKTLAWDGYSLETPSTDKGSLSVVGIDKNGLKTTLFSDIPVSQKNLDISSINAATYPGLEVVMHMSDTENRSPYQLKYWRVHGTPVPEGALAPNIYYGRTDTVEAGQPFNFDVAFKNVSDYSFDSLSVYLSIRNQNNVESVISTPKIKPLVSGDTAKVSIPIDTRAMAGTNLAFLEVNPNAHRLPEQFQFNNIISRNFYVRADTTNPYLDVTFDGVHILNRDIVSSKPDILMKLTDNSAYLLLDNTDLFKVRLRYPNGVMREYSFDNDTLTLTPAGNSGNNTATVNFKPYLPADGEYELVITAKDQTGNSAGNIDYRVAFQVVNKPMISNLLNYPNPFTTSTAFVFTLTGSETPQNMRIQILTVTGKIVREITKAELGPLHIGRNITEFKWDGTDQYGQKLANGVYLYRVITNLNGRSLDKYKAAGDNTDKYFNKGYGKMVLIR